MLDTLIGHYYSTLYNNTYTLIVIKEVVSKNAHKNENLFT